MSISLVTTSLRPSCLYFLLETLSTSSLFLQTPHVSKAKEKASLLTFFLSWCVGSSLLPWALSSCGEGLLWLRSSVAQGPAARGISLGQGPNPSPLP